MSDFGEVADNARGTNATQLNIGGTGIGAFNDRLRDGAERPDMNGPMGADLGFLKYGIFPGDAGIFTKGGEESSIYLFLLWLVPYPQESYPIYADFINHK